MIFENVQSSFALETIPLLIEVIDVDHIHTLRLKKKSKWDKNLLLTLTNAFRNATTLSLDVEEWKNAHHPILQHLTPNSFSFNFNFSGVNQPVLERDTSAVTLLTKHA